MLIEASRETSNHFDKITYACPETNFSGGTRLSSLITGPLPIS